MNNLIVICGAKRSGKDTVADYLVLKGYEKLSLADPLKDMLKVLFDFNDLQLEDEQKEKIDPKYGISPRQAMQFFGTEIMQYKINELMPCGRLFWVLKLKDKITFTNDKKYVISDMRFRHEYDEFKKMGAFIIKIDSNSYDQHISEQEYLTLTPDKIIKNDKDLASLYIQCDNLF